MVVYFRPNLIAMMMMMMTMTTTTTTTTTITTTRIIITMLLLLQVLRILPESVFCGRHLLREGDYITSVNGNSLERLTSSECHELLAAPSTVVCLELLREIDVKTSDDGRRGTEYNSRALEMAAEDEQLDRHHEDWTLRRCSAPNELSQNKLFARSKLRLSSRSAFDRDTPKDAQRQQQRHQPSHDGQVQDSTRSTSTGPHLASRRFPCIEEKSSEPNTHTDVLELPSHTLVSGDHVKNTSAVADLSKIPRVTKNLPTKAVQKSHCRLDRRTIKQSKGVRFKLSTHDQNAKEKKDVEQSTPEKASSIDRPMSSGKRHKVTATPVSYVKALPDLSENISGRPVVCHRLGTTLCVNLTAGDQKKNQKNRAFKPGTSVASDHKKNQKNRAFKPDIYPVVKQDGDFVVSYGAVDSFSVATSTASTGFSPYRSISSVDEGVTQELWVSPNAPTLKIYTSVINVGSNGNVVLTSRVTPSTYQSYLPRRRAFSRPFQISVTQGPSGLGIEVAALPSGAIITRIADSSPVGRNGNVRYGLFAPI